MFVKSRNRLSGTPVDPRPCRGGGGTIWSISGSVLAYTWGWEESVVSSARISREEQWASLNGSSAASSPDMGCLTLAVTLACSTPMPSAGPEGKGGTPDPKLGSTTRPPRPQAEREAANSLTGEQCQQLSKQSSQLTKTKPDRWDSSSIAVPTGGPRAKLILSEPNHFFCVT